MKTPILMGLVLLAGEPVPPQAGGTLAEAPVAQAATDWPEALLAEDLATREAAYEGLLEAARTDPATRRRLEGWAAGEGELGWTSKLALRELELRERLDADAPHRAPRAGGSGLSGGLAPFMSPFGASPFGASPFGADPLGRDLFRDLEDQLGAFLGRGLGGSSLTGPLANAQGLDSAQSFRMESGPGGVKVEVRERDGDEQETKTYEAESLEALLEAHPELRDRLGTRMPGGSLALGSRWDQGFGDLFDRLRQRRGLAPLGAQRIETAKLGVLMRPPGEWSASIEGLEEGTGLYVERVFPGTLAAELGVRPGDILISLNDRPLRGAEDVREVLAERAKLVGKAPVEAEVLDASGQRRALRWTPPDYEARRL